MKYIVFILVLVAIGLFLFQCHDNKSSANRKFQIISVDLNSKSKKLLTVKIKAIIPLETSDESIIGDPTKVIYFNNRIYVLDVWMKKVVVAFDENGKFLRKTSLGKGPGELVNPYTMSVRKIDSTIVVFDQAMSSFFYFDRDLNFLKKAEYKGSVDLDIDCLYGDCFLLYQNQLVETKSDGTQIIEHFKLSTNEFTNEKSLGIFKNGKKSQMMLNFVNVFGDEILFIAPWDYNVYQLEGDQVKIRYKFDFGRYNLSENEFSTLSTNEIRERMADGENVGLLYSIYRTKSFLGFLMSFRETVFTYFKALSNGESYHLNDCIEAHTIPDVMIRGIDNGSFYGIVDPGKLKEFQKYNGNLLKQNINENDNPYFVLFDLSEPPQNENSNSKAL